MQGRAHPMRETVDASLVPPYALRALAVLEAAGHEAFLVGGLVRDALLGKPAHDADVACAAPWEASASAFRAAGCDVIETGTKHGTITAFVDGHAVEVTTYRVDGAYSDGRHPDSVRFVNSIQDDLSRRDLTINAMAWNPQTGLVDPFGGRRDLAFGVVRAVGEPDVRMAEDALRVLRALRFSARLGFDIEPATAQAVLDHAPDLSRVAAERVGVEYGGIVEGAHAPEVLRAFLPAISVVVPEVTLMAGFDQHSRWHCFDVWEHCLHALELLDPAAPALVRHATLLHDVGKPECYTRDEAGHGHFYGHEEAGARCARAIFRRLRWRSLDIDRACLLIRVHDHRVEPTDRGVRRMLSRISNAYSGADSQAESIFEELLMLKRADVAAHAPGCVARREAELDEVQAAFDRVVAQRQVFRVRDLALSGRDVISLGVPWGPEVGRILKTLLNQVIDGKIENTRPALLAKARSLASPGQ